MGYRIFQRRGWFYVYENGARQCSFRTFEDAVKFIDDCEAANKFNIQRVKEETK